MSGPLIELQGVARRYGSGDEEVTVLHPLDVTIHAGEMIAIVGASGSGKSTLMNLLGCLDRPSGGRYLFCGQDTAMLSGLELAHLRCHHFGFIFQRYHLLPYLTAAANVEIPAIYAGSQRQTRQARSLQLLARLGLADRSHHTPGELSGGQQQRVSIARALMNGGDIILADEPTGALDSHSGQEVMTILKELHQQGHTIILVTHDMDIAQHADRIITLKDGQIAHDSGAITPSGTLPQLIEKVQASESHNNRDRYVEAMRMAFHAILTHRMRTFLTMLGIIIGIAAVVSVVALGQGASTNLIDRINAMGTNTIDIYPGKYWGDENAATIRTLNQGSLRALQALPHLIGVSPQIFSSGQLRVGGKTVSGSITGVSSDYFQVRGMTLVEGRLFNQRDIDRHTAVAIIDKTGISSLVGNTSPIGQVVLVGTLPVRIIGVVEQANAFAMNASTVKIWLPYSAVMTRLISQQHFNQITARVKDGVSPQLAEEAIVSVLTQRHGVKDFMTSNSDTFLQAVTKTTAVMTLLVSAIAVISLVVGGVGVMNIMLVSVIERTREIGIRMAVGARQRDILQQFLIEAVMVCLMGGLLGVALSLGIGVIFSLMVDTIHMEFSLLSILMAFLCSSFIGIVFGYLPARNGARLDPVIALARE